MKVQDIIRYVDYCENPVDRNLSAAYGCALRLMTFASRRRTETLRAVGARLWPAVKLGQIEFLFNSFGEPLAFATWAYLTQSMVEVMVEDPSYTLDISEWNEGDQLWVVDVLAPFGDARNLLRKVRKLHFPEQRRARALRVYSGQRAARLVDINLRALL
jgi:hemolysin-activating ACP:hemolysin acyltransferase